MLLRVFKKIYHYLYSRFKFQNIKVVKWEIDDQEFLVRIILSNHLKKNKVNDRELFIDTRGPVSLNRLNYSNENECKKQGLDIQLKTDGKNSYCGLSIFNYTDFISCHKNYNLLRPNFRADIIASPLDADGNSIKKNTKVLITDKGNPSHADLRYIQPDQKPEEHTPNTSLRNFSRELCKASTIILDSSEIKIWENESLMHFSNLTENYFDLRNKV